MIKERDLPEGWEEIELGNEKFFEILPSGIEKFQGEKEYLSTESIKTDKIEKVECNISLNDRPSRANMQPVINSVWFAKMQSTLKVYLFDEKNKEEVNKYILSTGFTGVKVNKKRVSPKYLRYFLFTKQFNRTKDSLCSGATQKAIKNEKIRTIKILIPSLETQKRIVSILEKVESAKNMRKDADELTKDYLNSVFLEMFGDPVKNTKNWGMTTIQESCDELYRYPTFYGFQYIEKGVPVIRINNILPTGIVNPDINNYVFIKKEISDKYPRTIIELKDILMAVRGDGSTASRIGLVNSHNLVGSNTSPNLLRFKTNSEVMDPIFFFMLITSKGGQKLLQNSVTRTAKKTITALNIKKMKIIKPPLTLQTKFSKIVEQVEKLKEYQKESKTQIEDLFNALMQKAFKGELI